MFNFQFLTKNPKSPTPSGKELRRLEVRLICMFYQWDLQASTISSCIYAKHFKVIVLNPEYKIVIAGKFIFSHVFSFPNFLVCYRASLIRFYVFRDYLFLRHTFTCTQDAL